jgi:hypothetical protein
MEDLDLPDLYPADHKMGMIRNFHPVNLIICDIENTLVVDQ